MEGKLKGLNSKKRKEHGEDEETRLLKNKIIISVDGRTYRDLALRNQDLLLQDALPGINVPGVLVKIGIDGLEGEAKAGREVQSVSEV